MSKITFRADADLVDRLEDLEGSKSEVMREALRQFLDDAEERSDGAPGASAVVAGTRAGDAEDDTGSLDDALAARVDELVTARLDEAFGPSGSRSLVGTSGPRPFSAPGVTGDAAPAVDLTVTVDGAGAVVESTAPADRAAAPEAGGSALDGDGPDSDTEDDVSDAGTRSCAQCGEGVSDDHVFCPNCGEKATRRLFCECGDEVRSDWAFCPGCGRRTPAADVLDAT